MAGHCYVAAEALYYLLGGRRSGYTVMRIRRKFMGGDTHWFLLAPGAREWTKKWIVDPTWDQFGPKGPPYHLAEFSFFVTNRRNAGPSNRAMELMRRIKYR